MSGPAAGAFDAGLRGALTVSGQRVGVAGPTDAARLKINAPSGEGGQIIDRGSEADPSSAPGLTIRSWNNVGNQITLQCFDTGGRSTLTWRDGQERDLARDFSHSDESEAIAQWQRGIYMPMPDDTPPEQSDMRVRFVIRGKLEFAIVQFPMARIEHSRNADDGYTDTAWQVGLHTVQRRGRMDVNGDREVIEQVVLIAGQDSASGMVQITRNADTGMGADGVSAWTPGGPMLNLNQIGAADNTDAINVVTRGGGRAMHIDFRGRFPGSGRAALHVESSTQPLDADGSPLVWFVQTHADSTEEVLRVSNDGSANEAMVVSQSAAAQALRVSHTDTGGSAASLRVTRRADSGSRVYGALIDLINAGAGPGIGLQVGASTEIPTRYAGVTVDLAQFVGDGSGLGIRVTNAALPTARAGLVFVSGGDQGGGEDRSRNIESFILMADDVAGGATAIPGRGPRDYFIFAGKLGVGNAPDVASPQKFSVDKDGAMVIDRSVTVAGMKLDPRNPANIQPAGMVAVTMDITRVRNGSSSAVALTSGRPHMQKVRLVKGDVITGAAWLLRTQATAAAVTHRWFFLANSSRQVLAISAEDPDLNGWASGLRELAFTDPYTVPATGDYYIGICEVVSSGSPTELKGDQPDSVSLGLITKGGNSASTGQTDPVAVGTTFGTISVGATLPFGGATGTKI